MKVSNEEIDQLPLGQYEGELCVVEHANDIEAAIAEMRQCAVLGFDTETRPSFTRGTVYNVALLQLSGPNKTWLFRLCKTGLPTQLADFLADATIKKAGLAIRDDLRGLRRLRIFEPGGFVDVQNMASRMGVEDLSLKKMAATVLGLRVSKRQRLTNWEYQTLTPGQITYAATDSWISLKLYEALSAGVTESPSLAAVRQAIANGDIAPAAHKNEEKEEMMKAKAQAQAESQTELTKEEDKESGGNTNN